MTIGGSQHSASGLRLQASFEHEQVQLHWTSQDTQKGTYFVIQRSTDGRDWGFIGGLAMTTPTNKLSEFTFSDQRIDSPVYYYKLKRVNPTGEVVFSNAVMVNTTFAPQIVLTPNPVQAELQLQLPACPLEGCIITLTNYAGQVVLVKELPPSAAPFHTQLETRQLPTGMYWISILADRQRFARRLLKL
ncbi:MAG: T9SS C-terminal target domain-containing protein [Bacteroidetes bacterium]|nr:MAG: T9SS C-terminal target domain-containing protein [Bacteroidota bacterium]